MQSDNANRLNVSRFAVGRVPLILAFSVMLISLMGGVVPAAASINGNTVNCTSLSGAFGIGFSAVTPTNAAVVATTGQTINSIIDANGCDVGVYVGNSVTGVTISATVSNALYAGIDVDGGSANVVASNVFNTGDVPFSGNQYGIDIFYGNGAQGEVTNSQISLYQKAGIVILGTGTVVAVSGDTVTGIGPTNAIAQNGVEVDSGASATVSNNQVSGNSYNDNAVADTKNYFTASYMSGGILLYEPGNDVTVQNNKVFNNDVGIWPYSPTPITINSISNNVHDNYGYDIVYDGVNGHITNTTVSNAPVGILATPESTNTILTVGGLTFSGVNTNYQTVPYDGFGSSILFSTPQQVMFVNANIINDEDSGNSGYYWAMDTFNRAIHVWQTGAFNYTINFTDSGSSFIPANAHSPQSGAVQVANGITTMNGQQSWTVVGTFNSLAAPSFPDNGFTTQPSLLTDNASIGTYNALGTISDLLLLSNQTGGAGSTSQSLAFANSYFANITSEVQPGYTYTYVYNGPLGTQTWIDTSNTAVSPGDIVTQKQIVNASVSIVNNPDSGNHGYWALDNYTRHITAYQTGPHSFTMIFNDSGNAYTFKGLPSPGNGIIEPNNGVAQFTGYATMYFNGTFAPGSNNVSGNLMQFDNHGALSGNVINKTANTVSTFKHFVDMYFSPEPTNITNVVAPQEWSWAYTNSSYPSGMSSWIDAYNGITGDIVAINTQKPVVNVTYKVKNAEDARWGPGYWALDNYTETVGIWEVAPGNYIANVIQTGMWCTFKGALSPNGNVLEPVNGCGQYSAHYGAVLDSATFNTSANVVTSGQLNNGNVFDFGGTKNAVLTGNSVGYDGPTTFDWVNYYFPGYTNFQYINVGGASLTNPEWLYTNDTYPAGANRLVESLSGASGDIITGPTVNVTYLIKNDEDYGNTGYYWALDNYTHKLRIWQVGPINYAIQAIYNGTWCTFKGALSPQHGIAEPSNGCGSIVGGYNAMLVTYAPLNTSANTIGSLGTFNDGGAQNDILLGGTAQQSGDPHPFDYRTYYFPVVNENNFTFDSYGWAYTYNAGPLVNGTWISSSAGSSGDIITQVSTTNSVVNVTMTIPANVPSHLNYSNANVILTITTSNEITANVLIKNVTNTTVTPPTNASNVFTKLLVMNVSITTSNTPSNNTYRFTVGYPCGLTVVPYELINGTWTALAHTTNAAACTISFNILPDPVVGIFSSTATPAPSGAGHGGVVSGGGGLPLATTTVAPATTIAPTTTVPATTSTPPAPAPTTTILPAPVVPTTVAPTASAAPPTSSAAPWYLNPVYLGGIVVAVAVIIVIAALAARNARMKGARKSR